LETLFYKLMYDTQLKRSMSMLNILSRAEHAILIKELETSLNVSKQTVLSTIEFARSLLTDDICLETTQKSVQLFNNSRRPIEVVLTEIAKQTIPNQVLEHTFENRKSNISDVAESLFVSESTLRAIITHMNKTLRIFNCRISFYDLKMCGTETDIRYFFYAYFSEFQELFHSLFQDKLQACFNTFEAFESVLITKNGKLLNYSSQQVVRWMVLARERLKVEQYVDVDESLMARIKSRPSYANFKNVYENAVIHSLNLPHIPEAEIVWAYTVSFNTIIYHSNDARDWCADEADNHIYKEELSAILTTVFDRLKIPKDCKDDFLAINTAYLLNLSLLTELSTCFQIGSAAIKHYVIQNLKQPYNIWLDWLPTLSDSHVFPISDVYTIATQLSMISSQFIYTQKKKVERVLFSFEGESGFPAHLESVARQLMPRGIENIFIYNEPISAKLVEQIQPDIVVSNHQIYEKLEGCKVLRTSYIPQIQEWIVLNKLLIDFGYDSFEK